MNQEATSYTEVRSIANLAEALAKAQAEIGPAEMDKTNPHFHSAYASFASIVKAIQPIYKHGLSFVQMPSIQDGQVVVTTRLMHVSGEYLECALSGPVASTRGNPVQAMGSTLSYLKRYALSAMLGVATGEDDDANSAGGDESRQRGYDKPHERTKRPASTKPPRPPQTPRSQQPTTIEIDRPQDGTAPATPPPGVPVVEKKRSKDPHKHLYATINELSIDTATMKMFLGVSTTRDASPEILERMDELAFALKKWDSDDLDNAKALIEATTLAELKAAFMALTDKQKKILEPCKDMLKKMLSDSAKPSENQAA